MSELWRRRRRKEDPGPSSSVRGRQVGGELVEHQKNTLSFEGRRKEEGLLVVYCGERERERERDSCQFLQKIIEIGV